MCKFNLVGMCTKGLQCPFAHVKSELRELPDLTCTKLCKTLIQTGLCEDRNCSYAHSKDELRATSTFHKTKLCRFSQMGHCALGSKCNFAHSEEEIRPLDTTKLPDPPVEMTPEPPRRLVPAMPPPMPVPVPAAAPPARPRSGAQTMQQQQRQLEQQQQQLQQQQMQQQIQMQQQQLQQQHQQLLDQQQQNKMLALALQHQLALSTNNFLRENIFPQSLPASGTEAESRQEREAPKRRGGRRGKAVRTGKGDAHGDEISGAPPGIPAWGVDANLWIPGQVRSPHPCAPGPISLADDRVPGVPGVPLSTSNVAAAAKVSTAPAGPGPAYVNSSMVNKTFLESELGPIGKMRPIRSAAGRLDRLAASESDEEEAQGLDSSLYDLSQAAGLVSHLAAPHLEVQLKERENRAGSAGATSAGSTQACPSHASTCLNAANGLWDSQLYAQSYSPSLEREDVWQVKNTFLTLSPRAKPIRSVRTADGALCELGSLLDDEA